MKRWLMKYWFMTGLVLLLVITLADTNEWLVGVGRWLKQHRGPDIVIVLIFFFSGMVLQADQIRRGLVDMKSTLTALCIIFVASPLIALAFGQASLNVQIITGLFLVAVMPSTLSSGVVMTGAAGGNMAHALMVTILANALAVFSIPVVLSLLLGSLDAARSIVIDKAAIMLKIALLVLLPLAAGLTVSFKGGSLIRPIQSKVQWINQSAILAIVWMALCQSRSALVSQLEALLPIGITVFAYHLILVAAAIAVIVFIRLPAGRRESVIFMGGQKTLPLSVILQVKLFPEYGLALAVCVLHHIVHLIMDGYLVERLKQRS